MSVVENLIQNSGLKYRDEQINLSNEELKILDELKNKFKSSEETKLFFQLPESNSLILRLIITELAYLSVGRQKVHFITDSVGKIFLFKTLKDLNTGVTDVYSLLMKNNRERVKVFSHNQIKRLEDDQILYVHFRNNSISDIFNSAKKQIIIFTSRDSRKIGKEYSEISSDLRGKKWSELNFHIPKKQAIKKGIAKIDLVDDQEIYNFFASIGSLMLESDSLMERIEEHVCFYSSLPVPIMYYYSYCDHEFNGIKNESILPSEAFSKINDVELAKKLAIKYIYNTIEQELFGKNKKFDHLISLFEFSYKNGEQTAILFPNKQFSRSFFWSLENINTTLRFPNEEDCYLYPELLTRELLLGEHIVDCILIPFVPSREVLIDASNLASKIILVLYQHEKEMLEHFLNKSLESSVLKDLTLSPLYSDNKAAPKKPYHFNKNKGNSNFKINYNVYYKIVRYLEKNDIIEEQEPFEYSAVIDNSRYIITSQDGDELLLHGWQHVILQTSGSLIYNYRWVLPSQLKKGYTVIIVPNELRLKYLQKELSQNINKVDGDLNDLIDYVADWKSALSSVSSKYSISKVQSRLKENGLSRSYATIRNWFEGLDSDPRVSAIASIINPGYNIGPQYGSDVKIFGETFGNQKLVDNHIYISAALESFRTSNRQTGRKVMRQILEDVKNNKNIECMKTIKISNYSGYS